jgi:hypothetical protein
MPPTTLEKKGVAGDTAKSLRVFELTRCCLLVRSDFLRCRDLENPWREVFVGHRSMVQTCEVQVLKRFAPMTATTEVSFDHLHQLFDTKPDLSLR